MPIDQNGNRAELVIYGGSTHRRSNYGRLYEHFLNATSRDLLMRHRASCGWDPHLRPTTQQLLQLKQKPELVEDIWQSLMRYYRITTPKQYALLKDDPDHYRHVAEILHDKDYKRPGINLWTPPDNPVDLIEMGQTIRDGEFRPHLGPVTYVDTAGIRRTTNENVLIGDLQFITLEKIGEDWSGVASAKRQHFGLPAKVTNADKYSTPGKERTVRTLGESETRSTISTAGPWFTNEMLDLTHNPESHSYAIQNILTAEEPTNIDVIVDRNVVPYGGSRSVMLVNHLLECRGLRFKYHPDKPVYVLKQ